MRKPHTGFDERMILVAISVFASDVKMRSLARVCAWLAVCRTSVMGQMLRWYEGPYGKASYRIVFIFGSWKKKCGVSLGKGTEASYE